MKERIPLSGLLTLALATLLFTFAPTVQAQPQSQQPNEQPGNNQQKGQVYTGQIVKAKNGQYALLVNKESGTGFYLDDQEKAKPFEGQTVKVTGVLDAPSSTIHVSNIQPV